MFESSQIFALFAPLLPFGKPAIPTTFWGFELRRSGAQKSSKAGTLTLVGSLERLPLAGKAKENHSCCKSPCFETKQDVHALIQASVKASEPLVFK